MKLLVDARPLVSEPRGVANYMINAILAISSHSDIELYLLSHKPLNKNVTERFQQKVNIHLKICPLRFLPNKGILWFIFYLPFLIKKNDCDCFWSGAVLLPFFVDKKIKTIITVHDVVLWLYPETMSFKNKVISFIFHDSSIKRANYIWAVSNYTKNELEKKVLKRKCNSIFVGSSIDFDLFKKIHVDDLEKERMFQKFGLNDRFIMFVGTLEPRKNLSFLLELMPEIVKRDPSLKLLVVGGRGWGKTNISQIISADTFPKDNLIFPGYIDDRDLVLLYNLASCFVSTSLNEGFGLPQLEAIACCCPVVTANNSAMTEVVSGAGVLVDGWNHQEWVDKISWAIENRDELLVKYPSKLKDYQWDKIVDGLLAYIGYE